MAPEEIIKKTKPLVLILIIFVLWSQGKFFSHHVHWDHSTLCPRKWLATSLLMNWTLPGLVPWPRGQLVWSGQVYAIQLS